VKLTLDGSFDSWSNAYIQESKQTKLKIRNKMKNSQREVKAAIMTLSSNKEAYREILKRAGVDTTIRMISYDLFVEGFNHYVEKNDARFEAYVVIREYAKEMKENGSVVFDQEFDSDEWTRKNLK